MWEFRLIETEKLNEKTFLFEKGHFTDEKSVREFANGACLKMVKINEVGIADPIYIEPTYMSQLIIFDGETFLFQNMYKRLFQNFNYAQGLVKIISDKDYNEEEEQILLRATVLFISSTLSAYLIDMIEVFSFNRYKEISNGSKEVFKSKYEQSLKRFNNASSRNLKAILKDLNLFPEVLDSIDYSKLDELTILRNKIAHGGAIEDTLTVEGIELYIDESIAFMREISSKLYRKMSINGDLQSWPHVYGQSEKIDKFWTLMPLIVSN